MGSLLRCLKNQNKELKLSDVKNHSGSGRLTFNVIDKLQMYNGSATRSRKTLDDMTNEVWATYFHYKSTDAERYVTIGDDS